MNSAVLISGLMIGSMYALAGLGLVLVYRSAKIVNLAHGAQATVAAFVFQEFRGETGLAIGIAVALLAAFATALVLERLTVGMMQGRDVLSRLAVTVGFLLFLQGMVNWVFGQDVPYGSQVFGGGTVEVLGVVLSADQVAVFTITLLVTAALVAFLRLTKIGVLMRAAADRPYIAELLGVHSRRMSQVAWGISGVLAGLAGVLLTPLLNLDPTVFALLVIQAYAALLVGRMVSLPFTLIGGLLIGVVQAIVAFHSDIIGLAQSSTFAIALVVLLLSGRKLAWSEAEGTLA